MLLVVPKLKAAMTVLWLVMKVLAAAACEDAAPWNKGAL